MASPQLSLSAHVHKVLVLGLPLIGGHLAQFAIGLTDTVMVGRYGVDELAALTLASGLFYILFFVGSGFAWAVMPLVAGFAAQEDHIQIRRATRMGLWLSLGFALVALPLLLFSGPILRSLDQSESIAALSQAYLQIAGFGLFPALAVMVLKSYLAALERTQIILWITVAAAVANAVGNYVLIFGMFGFPELGIRGAAIASVLTQVISLLGALWYIRKVLPEHDLFTRFWKPDPEMLRRVFSLGWPIGLTSLSEAGLFVVSSVMMGWLGTVPLAAHGIALQCATAAFMVHLGLSNAATVRAGNAFARRDARHLGQGALAVFGLSVLMSVLTMAVFFTMPGVLIDLFLDTDEPARAEILQVGAGLLIMAGLFQLVDGGQVVALGVLRGVQDTRVPMLLAGVSYWGLGLAGSYLLGFTFGLGGIGVWGGLVIGLGAAALLLNLRFWHHAIPRV